MRVTMEAEEKGNAVYLRVWRIEREGKVPLTSSDETFMNEEAAFRHLHQAIKQNQVNALQIEPPLERANSPKHYTVWRLKSLALETAAKTHDSLVRVVVESVWGMQQAVAKKSNNMLLIGHEEQVSKLDRFIITRTEIKVST